MKKQIEKRIDKLVTKIAVKAIRYIYRTRKKPLTVLTVDGQAVVNVNLMPLPITTETKKTSETHSGIIYDAAELVRRNPDPSLITIADPIPSELPEQELDGHGKLRSHERIFTIPEREVQTC